MSKLEETKCKSLVLQYLQLFMVTYTFYTSMSEQQPEDLFTGLTTDQVL